MIKGVKRYFTLFGIMISTINVYLNSIFSRIDSLNKDSYIVMIYTILEAIKNTNNKKIVYKG